MVDNLGKEGDVVTSRNFELDTFPNPQFTNMMKPQDFVYRSKAPSTIIMKVDDVPNHFVDVLDPVKGLSIQGIVKFIDHVYEYKQCPGKQVSLMQLLLNRFYFYFIQGEEQPMDWNLMEDSIQV